MEMDHYFFIHIVNWFFASLVVRDSWILHFRSIYDEIIGTTSDPSITPTHLELSVQHILPHLRECWWVHLILDVLVGNTPSIIIGMALSECLGIQGYDWLGSKGKESIGEWEIFHW